MPDSPINTFVKHIYPRAQQISSGQSKRIKRHRAKAFRAGIFKKSMGARHRVGIGFLYRPARLHRLAEFIPWNRFRGPIHVQKYQLRGLLYPYPYHDEFRSSHHRVHIFTRYETGLACLPTQLERTLQFTGDGKCNERGWACTPHPHQPGLILPS